MANFKVPDSPEYCEQIRKFETGDPGNASVFNAVVQLLINNDAFLKNMAERQRQLIQQNMSNVDATYQQATGYTDQKIADLINGAPSTLDTLGEIAKAMQDNGDVVGALNDAIGSKANEAEFDSYKKATDAVLGNVDISAIGNGTVTGAINSLNMRFGGISIIYCTQAEYDALGDGRPADTLYVIAG